MTLYTNNPSLEKTCLISYDVKVFKDGKPARLTDLSLRRRMSLQLAADMKTVTAIQQGDPEAERRKLARARRIFEYTDKDKDGEVTFKEYFALSEGQDAESRARWRTRFNRGDRGGDGTWSQKEFIMARTGRSERDLERGEGRVRRATDREGREREARRDRTREGE